MDYSVLEKKKKPGVKPTVTKEMAQKMQELSYQGYNSTSIGKLFNVDQSTVSRSIKKLREGKFNQ